MAKKIRTVVFLEPELDFLRRLKDSSRLVNIILTKVFRAYPCEGDKIAAAMAFLDGRDPLPANAPANASETLRRETRETIAESGRPKNILRGPGGPKSKGKRGRDLLSELSEAARDFDEN